MIGDVMDGTVQTWLQAEPVVVEKTDTHKVTHTSDTHKHKVTHTNIK